MSVRGEVALLLTICLAFSITMGHFLFCMAPSHWSHVKGTESYQILTQKMLQIDLSMMAMYEASSAVDAGDVQRPLMHNRV